MVYFIANWKEENNCFKYKSEKKADAEIDGRKNENE